MQGRSKLQARYLFNILSSAIISIIILLITSEFIAKESHAVLFAGILGILTFIDVYKRQVYFMAKDVVRHPVVAEIIKAYGDE